MTSFTYLGLPSRVIFGPGKRRTVSDEVKALGITHALIICTPNQQGQAVEISALLSDIDVTRYDKAVMHVPVETVADALAVVKSRGVNGCVCIGGGSTIGLAKALALEADLPNLAIPTTFAGSEMTPIWGKTEAGVKTTGRDNRVLPKTVIYDPELIYGLPLHIAGPSGINAMAHCVEALYSEQANPITSMQAEAGIKALGQSLPIIVTGEGNPQAWSDGLYGAWLAGSVLGSVGMAIHHKLCHTLGGSFNLPHADVHKVILPYATWYNRDHAPEAMAAIGRALGASASDAPGAIYDVSARLPGPLSLAELGMVQGDLDTAADIASRNPYFNPKPIEQEQILQLLQLAYAGKRP